MDVKCPFLGQKCTGGLHTDTWSGCAFKSDPNDECAQLAKVPKGMQPRDWYIEQLIALAEREKHA